MYDRQGLLSSAKLEVLYSPQVVDLGSYTLGTPGSSLGKEVPRVGIASLPNSFPSQNRHPGNLLHSRQPYSSSLPRPSQLHELQGGLTLFQQL